MNKGETMEMWNRETVPKVMEIVSTRLSQRDLISLLLVSPSIYRNLISHPSLWLVISSSFFLHQPYYIYIYIYKCVCVWMNNYRFILAILKNELRIYLFSKGFRLHHFLLPAWCCVCRCRDICLCLSMELVYWASL